MRHIDRREDNRWSKTLLFIVGNRRNIKRPNRNENVFAVKT